MRDDVGWPDLFSIVKARAAATRKAQDDAFADLLEVLNERPRDWRITAVSLDEGGPFKNELPAPVDVVKCCLTPDHFASFRPILDRFKPARGWPPHCTFRFEVSPGMADPFYPPRDKSALLNPLTTATADASHAQTRGTRTEYSRDEIKAEALRLMDYHGYFMPGDPEWDVQAKLVNALIEFCGYTGPGESLLKAYVPEWLDEWLRAKSSD